MKHTFLIQSIKYGIVGMMNTLVTIGVIWLVLHFGFGINGDAKATTMQSTVSNVLGFAAGLLNSFFFNRKWTFQSKKNWKIEFVKFTGVFLVCYIPQLMLVNLLNNNVKVNVLSFGIFGTYNFSFICQIIGNIFYTILNFICNKYYTFKK
jgi:putative flippase GtrA